MNPNDCRRELVKLIKTGKCDGWWVCGKYDPVISQMIAVFTLAIKKMTETVTTGAAYVDELTNAIRQVCEVEITVWLQTLRQAVPPM
jgi:hypothetical protein